MEKVKRTALPIITYHTNVLYYVIKELITTQELISVLFIQRTNLA